MDNELFVGPGQSGEHRLAGEASQFSRLLELWSMVAAISADDVVRLPLGSSDGGDREVVMPATCWEEGLDPVIVSCGEALVDLVPDPEPGGGPINVAIAAARLGAPAAFVGRVSTDDLGSMIWEHMVTAGVDLRAAQRGPEPTARAIVEHVPHLQFRFEGKGTADSCLDHVDLAVLGAAPTIVHGGTLGLFRGITAETLAKLAERHDGLVSLDPNVRPLIVDDRSRWDHFHQRWLSRSHVYRASDEDIDWIWPGRSPASIAAELLSAGRAVVIVTRGAVGATVYTPNGETAAPGVPVTVVDTVGAGDTFVAVVLAELDSLDLSGDPAGLRDLSLDSWQRIAALAVHGSALTCTRPGADPPNRSELAAFMEQRPGGV